MQMTQTQNQNGVAYLKELLAEVERQHPASEDAADLDDSVAFRFVLKTLIEVVSGPKNPLETLGVEMARAIATRLLMTMAEYETVSFRGDADLNAARKKQQIATILLQSIRIFTERLA